MALTDKQKEYIERNRSKLSIAKMAKALKVDPGEIKAEIARRQKHTPVGRRRLFTGAMLLVPVVFFALIEMGLRIGNYGGTTALFIPAHGDYAKYFRCNPRVGRRYFFMQNTVPDPPNDLFLKEKPANGYRIFALGGSTTAGYPYGNNIMFPRILQKRLADVFPERTIEVVNTAMTAVNTFTVLDFMDEIIEKDADAILIYSGHNEFYGALGAASNESLGKFRGFVKLYLKLQRFKFFILLRNWIGTAKKWVNRLLTDGDGTLPTATLMERMVGEQTIPYSAPLYQLGRRQFEGNLRDILRKAREAGLDVLISDLVSNVRDLRPFISVAADTLPPAEEVYAQAQALEKRGDFAQARHEYIRAKDLDALRFRATEDFNQVIRTVAADFDVPVVPMRAYFERQSPNGIIGNNLILEHLHPNVDGYFIMADAFFDAMHRERFIAARWDSTRIKPASFYRENWGFTALDQAYSDIRIRVLKGGWPFKPKAAPNRALVNYRPASKIDSVAWDIWRNDKMSLERGHVQLAEYYKARGELRKAFAEYKALIDATPLNSSPYLHAADILIKARRLQQAIPFLERSLKYENSAFANKWLGQIYLDQGRLKKALPYLEVAVEKAPGDPQLLYNLSGAYALNKQYAQAKASLQKLAKIRPGFPGAADLQRQLDKL